jgi:hypothetical protein
VVAGGWPPSRGWSDVRRSMSRMARLRLSQGRLWSVAGPPGGSAGVPERLRRYQLRRRERRADDQFVPDAAASAGRMTLPVSVQLELQAPGFQQLAHGQLQVGGGLLVLDEASIALTVSMAHSRVSSRTASVANTARSTGARGTRRSKRRAAPPAVPISHCALLGPGHRDDWRCPPDS